MWFNVTSSDWFVRAIQTIIPVFYHFDTLCRFFYFRSLLFEYLMMLMDNLTVTIKILRRYISIFGWKVNNPMNEIVRSWRYHAIMAVSVRSWRAPGDKKRRKLNTDYSKCIVCQQDNWRKKVKSFWKNWSLLAHIWSDFDCNVCLINWINFW